MFIIKKDYDKAIAGAIETGKNNSKKQISELKAQVSKYKVNEIKLNNKIELQDAELKVLRDNKASNIKLAKKEIDLDYRESVLAKNEDIQSEKSKELADRAKNIDSEEEANYVKGYADGVADGLRKVHEITAKDRDNLSKIAMVAAASHTNTETMKEINHEFRLTEGSADKKTK